MIQIKMTTVQDKKEKLKLKIGLWNDQSILPQLKKRDKKNEHDLFYKIIKQAK